MAADDHQQRTEVPTPADFQFDSSAIGNGVNLFRGSLAFSLPLASLPGRGGLSADIVAFYESGVDLGVDTWNLDAPTGVLGVGWSLPIERIVRDASTTLAPAAQRYYLDYQGRTAALLPVPHRWTRAVLGAADAAALADGAATADLRAALADQGVQLSDKAHVGATDGGGWQIDDPGTGRAFVLSPDADGAVVVQTGGQAYELSGYQFWQVVHYPEHETWEILKDDGATWTYGGTAGDGHAVQWGIAWGNWVGASTRAEGQRRYAVAWNLARTENPVGNFVAYDYEVVEQAVGAGDLLYTKECHVRRVRSDLGWSAVLHYGEMEYDTSSLDAPKEYLDPHHDPTTRSGTTPNAFQARYNTRFLDRITVRGPDDEVQSWLSFGYHELRNLTARDPDNLLGYGATYKRYLKSITQHFAAGATVPGPSFEYVNDVDESAARGALRRVVYGGGGTSEIAYRTIEVGADEGADPGARNRTIANPFGDVPGSFRTWYGSDYVVCAWYVPAATGVLLKAYTWTGRWSPWPGEWLELPADVDIDQLQVATSASTFLVAVGWADRPQSDVYAFRRDPGAVADWEQWRDDDGPVTHTYGTSSPALTAGDDFFVVVDSDAAVIDRYAWDWQTRAWSVDHLGDDHPDRRRFYAAARGPYHLDVVYDPTEGRSTLSLWYRDEALDWQLGGTLSTTAISAPTINGWSYLQVAPGGGLAALASVTAMHTGPSATTFDFQAFVVTWDEHFDNLALTALPDGVVHNVPLPILGSLGPTLVDDTLIGCGPELYRFDGVAWSHDSIGVHFQPSSTPATDYYWYAYAPDAVARTENTHSGIWATLTAVDPDDGDLQTWLIDQQEPTPGRARLAFPTLVGGTATFGTTVFSRSILPAWSEPAGLALGTLPGADIDSTTVLDEPPHFVAFMTVDDEDEATATDVAFYRNGAFARQADGTVVVEHLADRQMFRFLDRTHRAVASLSGKLPAVPDGFATFPVGQTVDTATELTLHRYARGSVQRPIVAHVVDHVVTASGYAGHAKCYAYADVSAAVDPSGAVIRFQTVTEYDGTRTPEGQQDGWTVSRFFNGLPAGSEGLVALDSGADAATGYSLLDGMLLRVERRDASGALVHATDNAWQVVREVAIDAEGQVMRPLYGGIVQVASTTVTQHGVARTTAYEYSRSSGSPTAITHGYYGSTGTFVERRQEMRYAFEVYPAMWQRWLLKPIAVSTVRGREDAGPWAVQASTVETSRAWTTATGRTYWAERDSWVPASADAPDFTWWSGPGPTSGWTRTRHVVERGRFGEIVRARDVQGREQHSVYDTESRFVVANFVAGGSTATYSGFEDYEDKTWAVAFGEGGIVAEDSFTGERCFELRSAATLRHRAAIDADSGGLHVFGGWVRTPTRSDVDLRLRVVSPSTGAVLEHPVAATAGEWRAVQWVVDVSQLEAATVDIEVALVGASGDAPPPWVRVDDLYFTPLESMFTARAYDVGQLRPSASIGFNGAVTRTLLNLREQPAVTIGRDGHVESIGAAFDVRTRAGFDEESFPRRSPNLDVAVTGRGMGFFDEFRAGSRRRYHAVGGEGDRWTVAGRQLRFDGSSSSLLGARVRRAGFAADAVAVYVLVDATAEDAVSVGTGHVFALWDGAAWRLVLDTDDGPTVIASDDSVGFQREWLLTVVDERVLLFAGGALVFSATVPSASHGVELGLRQPGSFHSLAVAEDVGVLLTYRDGLNRPVQTAALETADAAVVGGSLYDSLGRPAITLKPTRITGDDVDDPFRFQPDLVTNGHPDGSAWEGHALTGAIVGHHPDDDGYPFWRTVYEPSPLGRPTARGLPGRQFAVRPGNPHVASIAYLSNAGPGEFLWPLPLAQYFVRRDTDADGTVTEQWCDSEQQLVGTVVRPADGEARSAWRTSLRNDLLGRAVAVIPPAAYAQAPAGGSLPAGTSTTAYDFTGRRTSVSDPDKGTTDCVYDTAGLPRFVQDGRGREGGWFAYCKYDGLNRVIEQGVCTEPWDPDRLAAEADDPSFPVAGAWTTRLRYDGDGSTPHAVGRLWQAEADTDGDGAPDVVDAFEYDGGGSVTRRLRRDGDETWEIEHGYDPAGALRWSADSLTGTRVTRRYDHLGRPAAVDDDDGALAWLAYDQTGQVEHVAVRGGAVERSSAYNPVGWVAATRDAVLSEELHYTAGGCGGEGYWTGVVARRRSDCAGTDADTCFGVDFLGRVERAGTQTWDLDPNGNVLRASDESTTTTFGYGDPDAPNRLTGDSNGRSYSYDAVGATAAWSSGGSDEVSFTYGDVDHLVRQVAVAAGPTVSYRYDAMGQVCSKVVEGPGALRTRTLRDGDVLLDATTTAGVTTVVRSLAVGGLTLLLGDGRLHVGVTDHLGSLRALVDEDGTVVGRWDYGVHGETTVVQAPPFPVFRLYTGQAYDEATGLYHCGARLYDPSIGRFLAVDPRLEGPSPYVYVGGNPLVAVDPDGQAAWSAILAGIAVGAVVTLALGLVGGAALGGSLAAAVIAGSVAGAGGSVAGDAVTAAIGHEKFTWQRAVIDLGAGAAGGAVGALAGAAGSTAARVIALARGTTASTTSVAVTSAVSGGVGGSVAAAGVTGAGNSLFYHQPFFGRSLWVNLGVGVVSGAGAGLLTGALHWWGGAARPIGANDPSIRTAIDPPGLDLGDRRWWLSVPQGQAASTYSGFTNRGANPAGILRAFEVEGRTGDLVANHGIPFAALIDTADDVYRVMGPRTYAELLAHQPVGAPGRDRPLVMLVCFAAFGGRYSVAQTVADRLGRDVYAGRGIVYPGLPTEWHCFTPSPGPGPANA